MSRNAGGAGIRFLQVHPGVIATLPIVPGLDLNGGRRETSVQFGLAIEFHNLRAADAPRSGDGTRGVFQRRPSAAPPHPASPPRLLTSVTSHGNISLVRIRRAGFVFVAWRGDHTPRHVHVYRDGMIVLKWDLEEEKAMRGIASWEIVAIIAMLRSEGRL